MNKPSAIHSGHKYLSIVLCLLWIAASVSVSAQTVTIRGRVTDASTQEALPFVHVMIPGTQLGVASDIDGRFRILCPDTVKALQFSMMGYESKTMSIVRVNSLKVQLRPCTNSLKTVNIKGKRTNKRYKRKDNPAVELVQQVIAHREQNSLNSLPYYYRKHYSKTNLAFDNFHPNFQRHFFWKHLPFVEDYIDVTPFDDTEILHFSISETLKEECHRSPSTSSRYLTTAIREDGLARSASAENGGNVEEFVPVVDIYDNEIELLDNHFVSPLSATLSNATYHYYITDSLEIEGVQCVEVSFKPVNKSDYAFVGRMYIAVGDSSYAIQKYEMQVAQYANINWVHSVNILQDYHRDSLGHYLPTRSDTYGRFGLSDHIKLLKQIYTHSTHVFTGYSFRDTVTQFPDSLFNFASQSAVLPTARKVKRAQWNEMRPITLTSSELLIDSFRYELMRTPFVRHAIHGAMIFATGYIPTSGDRDSSRFDIGSIYNFYSVNALEGNRLRIGGMTKALLNPKNFADGYLAYGIADQRFKFGLNLTHTFDEKRNHANESPYNSLGLNLKYDVESPGVSYGLFDHDNILMASTTRMMEYVGSAQLRFRKQWGTSINLDMHLSAEDHTPAAELTYSRIAEDGSLEPVGHYNTYEWSTQLSLIPNQKTNDSRNNGALVSTSNSKKNPLSLTLGHSMGWFEGFYYNRTTCSAHKLLWLTPLGYMDLRLDAGKVWNQVPLPKLFFPSGTASFYLIPGSFNALSPMEFATDQYVAFFANYHLRGLLFNHLPIIRRLKLREVASFSLYWGSLSSRNDPANNHVGLYPLPSQTSRLGTVPYMEYSIGVENILHLIRIDYVNRLTYTEGHDSPLDHWRIGLEFSF